MTDTQQPPPTAGGRELGAAIAGARAARRPALITYLTLGYPTPDQTPALIAALAAGGADIIELGIPFSDPVADGPAIADASYAALAAGMTPERCLELAAAAGAGVPLVFMGYYNPILALGPADFARRARASGVSGLIVPDLPPEEAGPLGGACRTAGLALIFLASPTTTDERLAWIAGQSDGFLYLVTRLGTTGGGGLPAAEVVEHLRRARALSPLPVAAGFGIATPADVRALAPHADGIIVGSAIVQRAPAGPAAVEAFVADLRRAAEGEPFRC